MKVPELETIYCNLFDEDRERTKKRTSRNNDVLSLAMKLDFNEFSPLTSLFVITIFQATVQSISQSS